MNTEAKTEKKTEKKVEPTILYPFPLKGIEDSVYFNIKGAFVEKAELICNDVKFGTITPVYTTDDTPPEIELNFLGDKPFHAGLAASWRVVVNIYVRGGNIPSLAMRCADKTLTWKSLGTEYYTEPVVAQTDKDAVPMNIVYTPLMGGFKA